MSLTRLDRVTPTSLVQIAIAVGLAVVLWTSANVLLLLFFAVLLACVLRGAAASIAARTGAPVGPVLALIVIAAALVVGGLSYWIAPELLREGQDLWTHVADEWHALSQHFPPAATPTSARPPLTSLRGIESRVASSAGTILGPSMNMVAGLVIVLVTAIYLAAAPGLYVRGVLHLVPFSRRSRVHEAMLKIGHVLRLWVLGQLVAMLAVGVLAGGGLLLVGVPAPFALGVLTGLLTFIPYFGAIAAAVPAVLVALTVSWTTAIWALGVYTLCHCIEGYLVAPLVQRRLIALPPALTVMSMTFGGTLFGVLGIALGTPLAAAVLVAVRLLYVNDYLGDHATGTARGSAQMSPQSGDEVSGAAISEPY